MVLARVCSECGAPLAGKSVRAKTCSVRCRQARARRLRSAHVDARALEDTREIRDLVRTAGQDAVQQVIKQELAPVVREAIDDDVLRAISKMVGLTTRAVEVLAADLESEDAVIRQRSAALVVKYTVGHPALVKSADEMPPHLEVHFSLPRPDSEPILTEYDEDGQTVDERSCDMCGQLKPIAEFVAGSDRCSACFEESRREIRKQFGL